MFVKINCGLAVWEQPEGGGGADPACVCDWFQKNGGGHE